ncbi:hypothetical protein HK096_010278, partial [Nowakowskiella sp. JEL0078]
MSSRKRRSPSNSKAEAKKQRANRVVTPLETSIPLPNYTFRDLLGSGIIIESNPPPVQLEDLYRVHSIPYISRLLLECPVSNSKPSLVHFSPGNAGVKTTFLSSGSVDAIFHAAGACILAVDAVFGNYKEKVNSAFCVVRPPGHHCGRDGVEPLDTDNDLSQGFCFVNNVAASHAVDVYNSRVAIVDFDVHHGNGTEGIIRHLYDVFTAKNTSASSLQKFPYLFASLHQMTPLNTDGNVIDDDCFYPGTGATVPQSSTLSECIVNIPLKEGTKSEEFRINFENIVLTRLKKFSPDLIMISAGFDSHKDDIAGEVELLDDVI